LVILVKQHSQKLAATLRKALDRETNRLLAFKHLPLLICQGIRCRDVSQWIGLSFVVRSGILRISAVACGNSPAFAAGRCNQPRAELALISQSGKILVEFQT